MIHVYMLLKAIVLLLLAPFIFVISRMYPTLLIDFVMSLEQEVREYEEKYDKDYEDD